MNSLMKRIDTKCGEILPLENSELIDRLKSAFSVCAEKLLEVAAIIRVLEDRGVDLDELKLGMIHWFRRIAYGQVLPEIFERYRYNPRLLEVVAGLPIPDQSRLSKPCAITVLTCSNGEVAERKVDPIDMTSREIKQVFARGKIRNLTEQRGWLEDRQQPKRKQVQELESGVLVDKKKRCLVINGMRVSRSQLLSYLSQLGD